MENTVCINEVRYAIIPRIQRYLRKKSMRAEMITVFDKIKESLQLLRRHL